MCKSCGGGRGYASRRGGSYIRGYAGGYAARRGVHYGRRKIRRNYRGLARGLYNHSVLV